MIAKLKPRSLCFAGNYSISFNLSCYFRPHIPSLLTHELPSCSDIGYSRFNIARLLSHFLTKHFYSGPPLKLFFYQNDRKQPGGHFGSSSSCVNPQPRASQWPTMCGSRKSNLPWIKKTSIPSKHCKEVCASALF